MLLWQPVLSEEIQFLYTVDLGETSGVGGPVLASSLVRYVSHGRHSMLAEV